MSGLRLAVTGAGGRMGRAVVAAATERGHAVPVAVNRDPAVESVEGVAVAPAEELADLLAAHDPDALIDFTGPESSVAYVRTAAEAGVPAVVGTTGFDADQEDALREAADAIPVLRAANFSRGIQALERALRVALGALAGYDVELTETHHNDKRDAPSGTAKELLAAIEAERESQRAADDSGDADSGDGDRVHGREGDAPRREGEVGVHARRAGDVTGEHEVLLADNEEVLTLTHRAESRGVFAAGALDAAEWLAAQPAGFYGFDEVVDA
jgi:4-hydroxy-tetrahydrodipicolinate reductase